MDKLTLVKNAMLGVQRYPWEQGVCMQAVYEADDRTTAFAMAHDAVLRQLSDGRLAVTGNTYAVTDPAANGEVVWRAFEATGDSYYGGAAKRMLSYLMNDAPRTDDGTICHNEPSVEDGKPSRQIWVDSAYMAPPFLAVMGCLDEAEKQLIGIIDPLRDERTGCLYHIYDAQQKRFLRKKLWATGNGWALLGIGRVIGEAARAGREDIAARLTDTGRALLDSVLAFQMPDGRFHDILDDEGSFAEGTAAMMTAAFIYGGILSGRLDARYRAYADKTADTMEKYVDDIGIIHEVCGAPHFQTCGTSAESMAAYLMMMSRREKLDGGEAK